ncbi:MAG: FtsX-like permease family protein, partial [Sphingobacteriales bacterium]
FSAYQVFGSVPEFFTINGEKMQKGRMINELDLAERRKVAVLGERARLVLFKDEDAIGKYIKIRGVHFKVIGIFTTTGGEGREEERVYTPFTTFQNSFNQYNMVQMFGMTTKSGIPAKVIEEKAKVILAKRHHYDPNDEEAAFLNNNEEDHQRFVGLFGGIRMFIWIVGIGTLIAGIVGVSNIMLIIVKERTREIGVRKALGATPWSIVSLILQESVVITGLSGYLGLLAGVGLLDAMRSGIEKAGGNVPFFSNPGVDFSIAIAATIILVLAGAAAGLMPAIRAAQIKPIEALRAD